MMQRYTALWRSQIFSPEATAAAAAAAAARTDLVVFYASAAPLASNAMCHASAISWFDTETSPAAA